MVTTLSSVLPAGGLARSPFSTAGIRAGRHPHNLKNDKTFLINSFLPSSFRAQTHSKINDANLNKESIIAPQAATNYRFNRLLIFFNTPPAPVNTALSAKRAN
ncbi:hypothetical protein LU196_07495 [Pantoea sp. Mb-10]|uniref:hypothetical protein n=1 Tax=unclassified Pantoea TaxID=2630326 RepID=UPI001E589610|nr:MULTISPECIES: hypothetical protein [unclassified Pantoea]MCE0489895.1 hypothetical protein [Pantoea sp. Mb-10]MCE0500999.1 hypothetical protein [Pantoea sp. Pb-8]